MRMIRLMAMPMVALVLMAGCVRQGKILVPVQKTAAEQYAYAARMSDQANLAFIFDKKREYAEARRTVHEIWSAVVKNFPADREFTPLAKLNLTAMQAGLDEQHAPHSIHADKKAISAYQDLLKEYPDHTFLQAKARYDMGLVHKRDGNYEEAQQMFKYIRDNFAKDPNPRIRNLAERAAVYYQQIYTVGQ